MRSGKVTVEQINGLVTWTLIRAAHRVERSLTELERIWPAVLAANDLTRLGFTPVQSAELNARLHELPQRSGTGEPWSRPAQG